MCCLVCGSVWVCGCVGVCVCLRACVCVCYYIPCYSDRYERTRQQAPTANVLRATTTSFRERSDFQAKKFSSQRSARTLRYHTSFSAPKLPVTHLVFELPTAINTYPRPKSENKSQQVQSLKHSYFRQRYLHQYTSLRSPACAKTKLSSPTTIPLLEFLTNH